MLPQLLTLLEQSAASSVFSVGFGGKEEARHIGRVKFTQRILMILCVWFEILQPAFFDKSDLSLIMYFHS